MRKIEPDSKWILKSNHDYRVIITKIKDNMVFYKLIEYGNEKQNSSSIFYHNVNDFMALYE